MKQLVQDFRSGEIKVVDVPAPTAAPGFVIVRNAFSLVSAGTERSTVEMAQTSLLGKARKRPDLVRQVLTTIQKEGLAATIRKVQSRLDQWKQLGYATAGTVIEVGVGVTDFAVGDRVACAGQDYASHAEIVAVPQNLCAKIPAGVPFEHAAFTTLGAIALQGVRQADLRLGENVAVIGLGLVGQLTVLLLKAAGCRVFGHDPRVTLPGIETGANDSMDAVIITAATDSNDPLILAGNLCRDRGRVVMVGVTGMEVPRDIYYRKELTFVLSRSYGPGRYDPLYEEQGVDYPVGYVRWTEQRNMAAFLELRLDLAPLITHTFKIEEAAKAYDLITSKERYVGVLLQYAKTEDRRQKTESSRSSVVGRPSSVCLGAIGAGNYAQGVLLPLFKASKDVTLATVCTATGVKAEKAREKFGFAGSTTDWRTVVADPAINTVLVATRHNLHAEIVTAALRAGKTVFCEKPLCLNAAELAEILATGNQRLLVGFNRRFAPFAKPLPGPLVMRYRVSVTPLPKEHWVNDLAVGGGRILGEVCHFVDFLHHMANVGATFRSRPVEESRAEPSEARRGSPQPRSHNRIVTVFAQGFGADNVQVAMRFADGSVGSVDYFSVADAGLAKEHFEMFGGGQHVIVDEFRDKGQAEEVRQFIAAVKSGGPLPIAFDEIVASTRATFAILESMRTGRAIEV
jgi:polar amino acid transport system substrate-binding protein